MLSSIDLLVIWIISVLLVMFFRCSVLVDDSMGFMMKVCLFSVMLM